MGVAKRPGREKPAKIQQRKVWGPEWEPQVKQTALLDGPIYIGQAQGEKNIKRGARASSLSPTCWGALLFASLDQRALTPWRWIFLLSSKHNRAVTLSCNTDLSKSCNTVCPRPESCDPPRGLYCHSKSLLWRDKNRGAYTCLTLPLNSTKIPAVIRAAQELLTTITYSCGLNCITPKFICESPNPLRMWPYWK